MADDVAAGESRWDRLRIRLISIGLLVAGVLFLLRLTEDGVNVAMIIFFLIPAAMCLIPAAIMLHDARRVRRWPRARGVVVSTATVSMKGFPGSPARSHRPVVRYRYTVDGIERRGDTLWFGRTEGGNEGWVRSVLARNPAGVAVEVFYDPANPKRSSLEAVTSPVAWALLALGLVLLLGAILTFGVI
jgi:hypothetical protein